MGIVKKLKKLYRYTKNTFKTKKTTPIVLIYHRVANLTSDPQLLAVSPKKFEDQIKYLKKRFNVISLQQLVKDLSKGRLTDNSVVITFDDGYADNLYNAKPILEKYGVPATVFVTADMVDSDREYWWDNLERIFLLGDNIYKPLNVTVKGESFSWTINSREEAEKVYNEMHPLLKFTNVIERDRIIDQLISWAGLDLEGRKTHRSMTSQEVKELAAGGLISVGAHTMTHCTLSMETEERQAYEIEESKKFLEKLLGGKVESFSYPFGSASDANDITRDIVRQAGYNCGIANVQDNIDKTVDLFWIPRRLVRNWDINEFQDKLDDFLKFNELNILDVLRSKIIAQKTYKTQLSSCIVTPVQSPKPNKVTNILQINTLDCIGGAAKVAFRLNNSLIDKGYNAKILVDRALSDSDKIEVLVRHNSKLQKLLWNAQHKTAWLDFFHLASQDIKELDIFKQCDVLHLHNLHGNYFSLFTLPALTTIKPTIWTLHDMHAITGHCAHSFDCDKWLNGCGKCPYLNTYPNIPKDTSEFLWENKKYIYDRSRMTIVCPSNWLRSKVEKSILHGKDIRLIYNGIDETVFIRDDVESARKKLNLPTDKTILLFSAHGGAENYWKGGEFLSRAYNSLSHRDDLLFVNLGGHIGKQINKNWIDIPYVSDEHIMALYYSAADIFVYPSLADNCPLVVLEAMSCGTPVIAFNTGGIPELVRHLETGYLAKYKDTDDFIKGILLFADNPELRASAANQGQLDVSNRFTIRKMTNEYIKLYCEVTGI